MAGMWESEEMVGAEKAPKGGPERGWGTRLSPLPGEAVLFWSGAGR